MPRFARVIVPQFAHHITQRGNRRRDVFFTPGDRQVYLGLLRQYAEHYQLQILGYCLMTNHVHLIATPPEQASLAKAMREVHGRYARYRNAVESSSGHLWQNRYYSCAVEGVRLASVMRYVELNPVRAGLVRAAEDYAWSSALIHLGGADRTGLVETEAWLRDWPVEQWALELPRGEPDAAAIREATYSGRAFGSAGFVGDLERRLNRRIAPGKAGRPRKERADRAAG